MSSTPPTDQQASGTPDARHLGREAAARASRPAPDRSLSARLRSIVADGSSRLASALRGKQPPLRRSRAWLVAAAVPLFGVAAAFGLDPATDPSPVDTQTRVEAVTLPPLQATDDGDHFIREERIRRGDTVAGLLARLDVREEAAIEFMRLAPEAKPLQPLAPGRAVRAQTGIDGTLHWLEYVTARGRLLRVERDGAGFTAAEQALEPERRLEMRSGEIRSSLFAATDAAGLPDAVAVQIAEIFASDIDFHRDLRRGDTFTVIYESFHHQGERVRTGRVVAAEFVNGQRTLQGIWFEHQAGEGAYYTPEGRSLRRAFLRSPMEVSRVTSGFTNARFHPILQQMRAHRGIDYGAPVGTPVRAVANGTVEFAGRQGGYGNVVILAHPNNITTLYAHLNGFPAKVRKGARVSQGEVIGQVGMTGLTSGPHLHYEFRIAGQHVDPLRVALPEAPPITPALRAAFEAATAGPIARLQLLRGSNLARLE